MNRVIDATVDEATSESIDVDLMSSIRLILIARIVIVTALLGAALFIQVFYDIATDNLYFIIGLTYLITLFYSVLTGPLRQSRTFIYTQLVIDQILVSILIIVTGGIDSAFIILYYLPVVTAAVMLGRSSSLLIAILGSVLLTLVAVVANTNLVDLTIVYPFIKPALSTLAYQIILHVFSMLIIALISGYLAGLLQNTAANLKQRTIDLRKLQILNDNIIRSITSGIITTDIEGNISYANPEALRLFNSTLDDLKGKNIYAFLKLDPSAPEAIISENQWNREMLLEIQDQTNAEVNVIRSYLLGAGEDNRGKLYVLHDLREIKELRNKLMLKDRLATAGEMSAAIAHEIRNPLGAISGSAQMIRKSPDLADDQRYLMDIIVRESERLNNVLNDFLTFARQPEPTAHNIDIISVARETIDLISHSSQVSRNHSIEFLPGQIETLQAVVDPNMFKQMLYNLCLNAIRAMPEGGNLIVDIQEQDETFVLTVKDAGIGIPESKMQTMFQPFSTSSSGGVGLGLAIVYRIVQEHGGQINVKSKEKMGTSVTIVLPKKIGSNKDFSITFETAEP